MPSKFIAISVVATALIVRIDFDPAANLGPTTIGGNGRNTAMQIISGEQEATGGGIRSWQFRLDPIGFNPNAGGITAPVHTSVHK
jgi:hypothetical protein